MNDDVNEREDDMNCGLTVDERNLLRQRLQDLPDTMPPREVWQRIERQARAEGLFGRGGPGMPGLQWAVGAGLAAGLVIVALGLPFGGSEPPVTAADAEFPTVPEYRPASELGSYGEINALMARSQLLERDLRSLPGGPSVIRAGTAATIEDIEDRISMIDLQLNDPDADLSPGERETYWRERVRLMDSLLRLRYAQVQRVAF